MSGAPRGEPWSTSWDDALLRLEAVLNELPEDRTLPPIGEIVAAADLPEAFLREDERARKLLHDAIEVRPLSRVDRVAHLRTEVELLTLEVGVLVDRLEQARDPAEAAQAAERVEEVRGRLEEIRRLL